jgi:hypothetical protein
MYDEPERKRRREYVNRGRSSVRTQHMGSLVRSCSREIASVGVETLSKCRLTHSATAGNSSQYPCRAQIFLYKRRVLTKQTKKLRGLSPRANYTDRATAACRRS